jgi:hypothetical protein
MLVPMLVVALLGIVHDSSSLIFISSVRKVSFSRMYVRRERVSLDIFRGYNM